ncbi:hypothetical protein BG004_001424, partial [Podila humilis]
MQIQQLELLIQRNRQVTEWSFMHLDAQPALFKQLLQVPNVVTYLEIVYRKSSGIDTYRVDDEFMSTLYEMPIDIVAQGLHEYLCNSPHLLHLKTNHVVCFTASIDPFPTGLRTWKDMDEPPKLPAMQIWACKQLQTLSLRYVAEVETFSLRYNDEYDRTAINKPCTRTFLGYLARVCPKIKRLYLEFYDASLDLQSGLCLLSRLKDLESIAFKISVRESKPSLMTPELSNILWENSMDLSWLTCGAIPLRTRMNWKTAFLKWRLTLSSSRMQERSLIKKREAYMAQCEGRFDSEVLDSWSHLGTLVDVENCLSEIASNGGQCWPRLETFYVRDVNDD